MTSESSLASTGSDSSLQPADLSKEIRPGEIFWCRYREWLEVQGYALRTRFQAGWTPSWEGTGRKRASCEDGQFRIINVIADATHVETGEFVVLKRVSTKDHPLEAEIGSWLSAEPQRSDPDNHCVPFREVLQSPFKSDEQIVVMPLLQTYDKPRFDTVGEAIAFFTQILKGLRYMHRHNVAHRDVGHLNIMMDGAPLYPVPVHPVNNTMKRDWSGRISYRSRTQRPVRYYLIDFGLSRRYEREDFPVFEWPIFGGDKSVPEHQIKDRRVPPPCDPFATDVYCMGNLIREDFTEQVYKPQARVFDFLKPLVADMVHEDPAKRPSMDEVVERFEDLVRGLSAWKLRSRVGKDKHYFGVFLSVSHWVRKVRLVVGGYPAMPTP
ncbi:kinase-like domain-containing protein [Mycena vitilis]|nr:kinase-like domain-containing protein [Mycena vitilis]